jgi:phosphopantothenoylcysteine decarboxylase/phosphopantothenate--cysteine ligase
MTAEPHVSENPRPSVVGPRIVLGVCGGIAAYKAVEVCRLLVDAGAHVIPVLTSEATRFIGAVTFSALASEPAQTSLWDEDSPIPHTRLGQSADLIVVVPATAHLLARYAVGLSDDLLTATLLATRAPVLVCPAMHTEMWEHPSVRENLATLERRGVGIVPPAVGRLAGGDSGEGRLADPSVIATRALALVGLSAADGLGAADGVGAADGLGAADVRPDLDLSGLHVVVSAGGTREALDPVRYLTNRSSGKQGNALAEAAARRGARVTLVTASGLTLSPDVQAAVTRIEVESAADMEAALARACPGADVVIMAAAVADFRPKVAADHKLSKEDGLPELVLEPTPDILTGLVSRRTPGQVLVGFAAETDDVAGRGRRKLQRKGVDLLVVNDVSAAETGFDHDTNAVSILKADGSSTEIPLTSKYAVANAVLDSVIAHRIAHKNEKRRSP